MLRRAFALASAGLALGAAAPPGRARLLALDDASQVRGRNVSVAAVAYRGSRALEVRIATPYAGPDRDYYAYVPGLDFHDGAIEVDVAGSILPNAAPGARGFIGLTFRGDEAGGTFATEGFYIRPTNGRADDQVRRNHSVQYFAYPDWSFERFRREAPERYEAYVDLVPGAWTRIRAEVRGASARFFANGATQPTLIVNDLKRGADAHGTVGLYVDDGTDGHFRRLRITPT